jgi:hypothetical protein
MIKRYYHYTTIKNLQRILASKILKPSYFSKHDTTHGEGWYLTDLTPNHSDLIIQKTLWNANIPEKTKCYIAFDIEESILKKCNNHIYLIKLNSLPEDILNLNTKYFEENTFYSVNSAKVVLKYAGFNIRKKTVKNQKTDWTPIIQVAAVFVGIIGVAALINAILESK